LIYFDFFKILILFQISQKFHAAAAGRAVLLYLPSGNMQI
jgi:hypothetical protein